MSKLDIIIVEWKSEKHLIPLLQDLIKKDECCHIISNIFVFLNYPLSKDYHISSRVTFICSPVNVGFAAACNQAASFGLSPYILFLNPDASPMEDCLERCLAFMEEHKDITILGCKSVDREGKFVKTCAPFPTPLSLCLQSLGFHVLFSKKFNGRVLTFCHPQNSAVVDQVIGAFLLLRREDFVFFKGFDERFFVYYEEVDLCYRAKLAGKKVYYFTESCFKHEGGASSSQAIDYRTFYNLRSRLLFAKKHFSPFKFKVVLFFVIAIEPLSRCLYFLIKNDFNKIKSTFKGYKYLYKSIFLEKLV